MSLLESRDGTSGRGIVDSGSQDNTSRTIADARAPIAARSTGVTESSPQPDIVVTPRYLAPVREPLQPRGTGARIADNVIATNQGIDPSLPFGDAFTKFLGGGSGGGGFDNAYGQQPVRVIPTQGGGGNNNLLLLLGLIGAAGAIYYFYEKRKRGGE